MARRSQTIEPGERRIRVTGHDVPPTRLEPLDDDTHFVPHHCHCEISEKDMPTVELELVFSEGQLRPRSITIRDESESGELRSSDMRLPLTTYLRLATLTVAYRREERGNLYAFIPVAPYGGRSWFRLEGSEITPLHAGDWDEDITARADEIIRQPHKRSRRPYGRLDEQHRDELLKRIAERYLAAAAAGEPPIKTIMREEYVSRPTASRWIALARERELLPPSHGPHGWRQLHTDHGPAS